ncbi:MAG: CTP synthase [Bacteroidota bacterium]
MKIGIIGEYDPSFRPHVATMEALQHVKDEIQKDFSWTWVGTDELRKHFGAISRLFDAFWIAPGSPYQDMEAALWIIAYCRSNAIPTLGTCGGFQHMVIEYARNVLGIADAQHAEYDPYASKLVVNPLACQIAGEKLRIELTDAGAKIFQIYGGQHQIEEKYYCNFGLNPAYQQQLHESGFRVVGKESNGEARILELTHHPFFIATLFVPQDQSTAEYPHPLVRAFAEAGLKRI